MYYSQVYREMTPNHDIPSSYRFFFFTGTPPKSSKYKIKLEYQDWYPPKTPKCQPVSKFPRKKFKYLDWYSPKISVYNETWNNPIVIQCGIEPVIDFKGWDSDSHESVSK